MGHLNWIGGSTTEIVRPLAHFPPDIWGQVFLNYSPPDEGSQNGMREEINRLKKELRKDLSMPKMKDPKERLLLIDKIQRLGVAYHFEEEIEVNLRQFHKNDIDELLYKNDLQYVSLRFRLLRQHGFFISTDIFEKFKNENGRLMDDLPNDLEGILSLYEACHLRLHGEDILEEALVFTITHLTSISCCSSMAEQISHSLKRPLYKCTTGLEAKYQISVYEMDPSHHEALLNLAKLTFNFLQSQYKKDLRDLFRWTRNLEYERKFPFARERIAENYYWALGACYEPKYSNARILLAKFSILITVVDDIFDSYGTIHELELFTHAIHRWNSSCMNQLPDYMKFIYEILLDIFQVLEQELAHEGRTYAVSYLKKELQVQCEAYLEEARWLQQKLIPTYEEYMEKGRISCCFSLSIMATLQGMGEIASKESFEWFSHKSKAKKASGILCRIMNDLAGHKKEQTRNHIPSSVECYMANFGVSEEDACKELKKKVEEEWKNVRAEIFRPTVVPMAILMLIVNACRTMYDLYRDNEDSFLRTEFMRSQIEELFIKPVI